MMMAQVMEPDLMMPLEEQEQEQLFLAMWDSKKLKVDKVLICLE